MDFGLRKGDNSHGNFRRRGHKRQIRGRGCGKKAGQIVDVSKLRINVAELNAEISKRYEALGEYVYENCREALAEDAESVGKMAEIDELVNQRNILTKELVDKQNKVVCPSCGKQSPITAPTAAAAAPS